jgi:RimJ/RimL family protein N-acetyltransferase
MAFTSIRTDRLLLRPVRENDVDAAFERRSDPEVAKYQDWSMPYSRERAEESIARALTVDGPTEDAWWMVTVADPDDTVVLGDLVAHLTWQGRSAEIGYTFARHAWGQGYALEAATALVRYLFDDVGVHRVEGKLHPDNIASAMLLERLGLRFEGRTRGSFWLDGENSDDAIYGAVRADWESWRDRPRDRPETVALVEVTPDNLTAVGRMETHKSQERFVAPNLWSLAEALVPEPYEGHPVVPWYRAVEADGELAAFVMMALPGPAQEHPYLWRLLVDRRHQRRGIGTRVLDLLVEECRAMGATALEVSWEPGRGSPEPMYLRYGFVPTGDVEDGEIVARMVFP